MNPSQQLTILQKSLSGLSFAEKISAAGFSPFRATTVSILQMNITKKCNLACRHCHVESSPSRTEEMSRETLQHCLNVADKGEITTVDITGGAPEMHPNLEWFLDKVSLLNKRLIVRSNLTILLEENYSRFIDIFVRNKVELVASLPDPAEIRTDKQRGKGTFSKLIRAIKLLNAKGYGMLNSELKLDIVHNPAGCFLSGSQSAIETEYRRILKSEYGISFSQLFCLNNCPIGRFLNYLVDTDNLTDYMRDLEASFNPKAAENVMCRSTISVGYDGTIYDCDFNQMLEMPIGDKSVCYISNYNFERLKNREIEINEHCYSCTAGAGSSCQGATA
jgi:radical SAM/Cys-rich protein